MSSYGSVMSARLVPARVVFIDRARGVEEVAVGDHSIELSAFGPHGFCHNHQSPDCLGSLTAAEADALADCQLLAYAN